MKVFVYSVFLFVQISLNYGASPLVQHKCRTWDSACLKARAQAATPSLTAGIPEKGVERLDPMYIDSFYFEQDGLKFDMRNVSVEGLRNAIIDTISVDMNSCIMRLVFHTDILTKSVYTAGGYLFSLPITGHGDYELRYINLLIEMVIPFEIIKDVHGKDVMNLKEYKYWYDVRDNGQQSFGNLYDGDKKSSDRMHALVSQNWKCLSMQFGRQLLDKVNDKIFNAIRTYMRSQISG